ncbi:Anaerobic dimethyl sulfoxide reductase chain C [Rhodovastum atsumiense]|uniref:Dimethyl sulfoxide reductase n=1 Tax=Rhodovastum atsumiense TaxID=504468 RepID=A0A5M6IYU5_9PROT|nr:DmsC/YnfH family molybdoenzyme membrane anchor subunit [Rhodovastum atsumiense]KAA5613502.1 hypothetical protein F1189_05450 [Rhodovastum atsumiense]CAH2603249.1 Anaerobic dimethyl sulfoxide reductase chain C [Rhodovastum atsumiense]
MYTEDWPLVVFTLLVQTAAGMAVVGELARLAGGPGARRLLAQREIVALVLGGIGLAFSFAHLGTPAHSPFALLNLGQSWLSREILCTGAFLACLAGLTLARRSEGLAGLAGPLALLAGLSGLASVFAMSKVYAIVTVPAWNSPATLLNFAGSALLLGTIAIGALVSLHWARATGLELGAPLLRVTTVLLLALGLGLAAKVVEIPMSLIAGAETNARGISALSVVLGDGLGLFALRLVLLVAGVALFAQGAILKLRNGMAMVPMLGACAFLVTLAGEALGRLAFFRMHVLFGL